MPLHSSSGGQSGFPSRTATRTMRPPMLRVLMCSPSPARRGRAVTTRSRSLQRRLAGSGPGGSVVIDIGSRRVTYRRQPAAA